MLIDSDMFQIKIKDEIIRLQRKLINDGPRTGFASGKTKGALDELLMLDDYLSHIEDEKLEDMQKEHIASDPKVAAEIIKKYCADHMCEYCDFNRPDPDSNEIPNCMFLGKPEVYKCGRIPIEWDMKEGESSCPYAE